MPRQFTPEEEAIIRETKRQGEEEAARNPNPKREKARATRDLIVFAAIFVGLAFLAYTILIMVS